MLISAVDIVAQGLPYVNSLGKTIWSETREIDQNMGARNCWLHCIVDFLISSSFPY